MFQRVYRQRRRILTCATLFTLTALITSQGTASSLSYLPVWVFPTALAIFFSGAALAVALLVTLFPSLRSLFEVLGIFTLAEAMLIWAAPGINAALDDTVLRLAIAGAMIGLIHLSLYGRLLDGVPALFSFGARSQVRIVSHPNQVWNAVVPQQTAKSYNWAGKEYDVLSHPQAGDTVRLRHALDGERYEMQSVTFVEKERPYRCRYHFSGDNSASGDEMPDGIYDFKITPKEGYTQVDVSLYRTGTRLRHMLRMWFDDALGAQMDTLKARLEGRSRSQIVLGWITGRKTA